MKEAEFMKEAAHDSLVAIRLGTIAEKQAVHERVKNFARMIKSDHSSSLDQLKSIASREKIPLKDSLSDKERRAIDEITHQDGDEFDKAFIKKINEDHKTIVPAFNRKLDEVQDLNLKKWIIYTLPLMKRHRDSARSISNMLDSPANERPDSVTP